MAELPNLPYGCTDKDIDDAFPDVAEWEGSFTAVREEMIADGIPFTADGVLLYAVKEDMWESIEDILKNHPDTSDKYWDYALHERWEDLKTALDWLAEDLKEERYE